ncbi:flagellar biosynthetic protein FliR [Thauera sp. CAU 1555]|uniref:Flagellar biosynthetic protein FliR n=1 Tax=Thauera sedimentorum TaxID=2767595 RepID=A0ABR9B6A0_9RHOO|nr:flagellar biosynthetic protein FliR [Thauera sedimentorum]MBC9070797.1 flagellar biosynthetic protein FliR [Thauera sedimentorum]MBD8501716.1 flagellar biosynthetic protein FliR [Thauera sedimentorum]
MLSVTYDQLAGWLTAFMYPLARLLGMFASAPVFSNRAVPTRARLGIGLGISIAIVPALPPIPAIDPGSYMGLLALFWQIAIGVAIGFMMRLVFAAIDMAGSLVGMQMGLSFAIFFSPGTGGQTAVLSEFLGLVATLLFLAINGHLLMIDVLVRSFEWLPITTAPLSSGGWSFIVRYATVVFATGLLLSLPMLTALLVTNIALGILTRASPQLNLFAIGFPVSLAMGMMVLMLAMHFLGPVILSFFEQGFAAIESMLAALA